MRANRRSQVPLVVQLWRLKRLAMRRIQRCIALEPSVRERERDDTACAERIVAVRFHDPRYLNEKEGAFVTTADGRHFRRFKNFGQRESYFLDALFQSDSFIGVSSKQRALKADLNNLRSLLSGQMPCKPDGAAGHG